MIEFLEVNVMLIVFTVLKIRRRKIGFHGNGYRLGTSDDKSHGTTKNKSRTCNKHELWRTSALVKCWVFFFTLQHAILIYIFL